MTKQAGMFKVHDYCVSWVDLLRQRNLYKNDGCLQQFATSEEEQVFFKHVNETVGVIDDLQSTTDDFLKPLLNEQSCHEAKLPSQLHPFRPVYDEMRKSRIVRQCCADGVVCFSALNALGVRCPMPDVHHLIIQAGFLCFLGLVKGCPVRGGIDIAWATELHSGGLYGAAVVKAYELESTATQYPRIIVGERLVTFLETWTQNKDNAILSKYQKQLARTCRELIGVDNDRLFFVDYLSDAFTRMIPSGKILLLYSKALEFINQQIIEHRKAGNLKLSSRYGTLLNYFEHQKPQIQK